VSEERLAALAAGLEPEALAALLRGRRARRLPRLVAPRRSAVAAILRPGPEGPEVLLMKRAARDGDRWSGQIAMPGGMAEAHDRNSRATAVRETLEEVGLDLTRHARVLGRLDDQVAIARGRPLPLAITPWVFATERAAALRLNEEAELAFWLPLLRAAGGGIDDSVTVELAGLAQRLPAWRHEGHLVWGLTHRMLSALLKIAARAGR
jgi:8-oxo-dGTP pyrophosphatase MutT (NUDIX family)